MQIFFNVLSGNELYGNA